MEKITTLEEEKTRLEAHVANLELSLRYTQGQTDSTNDILESATEAPPTTVEEAVLIASERFQHTLTFGSASYEGVPTLASDAGPPDKILSYLSTLSEMTEARRSGSLGTAPVKWLQDRGVTCSTESETILNSKDEMNARTWDDGNGNVREFKYHLKPKDGTSPDQCVRIYFDYDEATQKTIVGWIGRHPGT